jgi:hypothetical protein
MIYHHHDGAQARSSPPRGQGTLGQRYEDDSLSYCSLKKVVAASQWWTSRTSWQAWLTGTTECWARWRRHGASGGTEGGWSGDVACCPWWLAGCSRALGLLGSCLKHTSSDHDVLKPQTWYPELASAPDQGLDAQPVPASDRRLDALVVTRLECGAGDARAARPGGSSTSESGSDIDNALSKTEATWPALQPADDGARRRHRHQAWIVK